MKATGRADLAANEKVLDLYTSNLQLEEQLHGVRRQVDDAKAIAEKVCCQAYPTSLSHSKLGSESSWTSQAQPLGMVHYSWS